MSMQEVIYFCRISIQYNSTIAAQFEVGMNEVLLVS